MEGADLWEAVEDDYEVTDLPTNPIINQIRYHKESVTRKAKAKSCMYATVSPTIFTRIMRLESAKSIWDYLNEEYEGDEKINLLREFERLQMGERETVKEFVDRLVEIANKIRVLGVNIKDDRVALCREVRMYAWVCVTRRLECKRNVRLEQAPVVSDVETSKSRRLIKVTWLV
ncbi:hypothetical protein CRG98_038305 [Punica granatum]|uniref:Uncharacterized protein n=1 Tax=Punica granatum TaxID=22663 RepID=A0A2I0IBA6_PUNGR|nr:hypothetical protein CRG98_038305 [Punica granatum]